MSTQRETPRQGFGASDTITVVIAVGAWVLSAWLLTGAGVPEPFNLAVGLVVGFVFLYPLSKRRTEGIPRKGGVLLGLVRPLLLRLERRSPLLAYLTWCLFLLGLALLISYPVYLLSQ